MEIFNTLAELGITPKVMQIGIVVIIVMILIALYWRMLAIGAGVLFCVVVFAMPAKSDKMITIDPPQTIQEVVPQLDTNELGKKEFMHDCINYGQEPKSKCEAMWQDRENGVEPVKGKMWNRLYMKKV